MFQLSTAANVRMSHLSTTYIQALVHWYMDSETFQNIVVNPSGSVEFAFMGVGEVPEATDWVPGLWDGHGSDYYAQCLVGPEGGVISLPKGLYDIWIKVILLPEIGVEQKGQLTIY